VGVARSAFEIAREYCDTRKAFGKPIGHFQAVAFTLADRLMDVESGALAGVARGGRVGRGGLAPRRRRSAERRALLARRRPSPTPSRRPCAAPTTASQLHGGAGFIRDCIAEKLMRDAKQLALSR
jgi:alkylation response protein AidB-like acyl-CoA dehydrogenase